MKRAGAAEALRREHGQVLDVLELAGTEERLQQRVAQHAVVEGLLEAMQGLLAAGMLEQRRHLGKLAMRIRGLIDPGIYKLPPR